MKYALLFAVLCLSAHADTPLTNSTRPRIRLTVTGALGPFELTRYPDTGTAMTSSLYYQDGAFGRSVYYRPHCSIFIHHAGTQIARAPSGSYTVTRIRTRVWTVDDFFHRNVSLDISHGSGGTTIDCDLYTRQNRYITLEEMQAAFGNLIRFERY